MKVPNIIKEMGFSVAYSYLDKNPEENLPKLLDMMEKIAGGDFGPQIQAFRDAATNQDGNWFKLIKSVWTDIDDNVRHTLFNNFFLNASLIGWDKQEKYRKKYGCNIPWAILMDPTSACNLKCIGCWAAEYGNRLNMSFEQLDDIVRQGKEMGTYMYIFSGGEPLVRKKDIIRLCEKHDDCEFLAFTNATLIDEEFANEMLRVTNFIPAISVEGFKEATDARRGEGTFDAVMKAMRILKEKKLPFGVSCCYTSQNYQVIGSEEYFDAMIEWGAKFAWFFTYMPVGADAVPELM
ncbi:MAG: radical SAM protein, partial [Clostridia bacterium]|nr:radical SAM protein [Clostridia bacterium]